MELVAIILWPVIGVMYVIYKYLTQEGEMSSGKAMLCILLGFAALIGFGALVSTDIGDEIGILVGGLFAIGLLCIVVWLVCGDLRSAVDRYTGANQSEAGLNESDKVSTIMVQDSNAEQIDKTELLAEMSAEEKAQILNLTQTEYELLAKTLSEAELNDYLLSQIEV